MTQRVWVHTTKYWEKPYDGMRLYKPFLGQIWEFKSISNTSFEVTITHSNRTCMPHFEVCVFDDGEVYFL